MVSLRPITDANREAVEALAVAPGQRRYVSGVRESMLEAAREPDAHALYWAIYDEETPVGFVMIADDVDRPEYIPHFRTGEVETMWTSAAEGDGSPISFYERYGFERTGDRHGNEVLLRLESS